MSVRALVPASGNSATSSDPYWSNVSLLVNGENTSYDANWSNVSLLLNGDSKTSDFDQYWGNVSLLLTGDDFVDASNVTNTITNTGSVTVNTGTKVYGTGSYYFNGSNYLITNANVAGLNLGSGSFTVEMWLRFDSFTQYDRPFSIGYGTSSGNYLYTEGLVFEALSTGSSSVVSAICMGNGASVSVSTPTLSANTWYHIAFVRSGNSVCVFTNGIPSATASFSQAVNFDSTTRLTLGAWYVTGWNSYNRLFKGYIDNVRVTKGVARYWPAFTPPTSALPANSTDPYYSSVALLISGDGANGSTTITDSSSSPVAITVNGNAQISTAQKKYGTGAIMFDGSGDYLTISNSTTFALGTNDFTIELWVYPTTLNAYAGILSSAANTSPYWTYFTGAWQINFGASSSVVGFAVSTSPGSYWASTETPAIPLNQWNHIAVTRSGLVIRKYLNGVLSTTDTMPGNYTFASDGTSVVGKHDIRGGMDFTGYMDDIRITKGVVRYTANFTPSSCPVNSILDKSASPLTLTVYNAVQLAAMAKYGNASISFNGSNTAISFAQAKTVTGTEDYTVESWVYLTSTTGSPAIIGNANDNGFFFGFNTTYNVSGTSNGLRVGRANIIDCEYVPYQFLANTWYHVAVTRTASTIRFFINGVLQTTSGTGTATYSYPTTGTTPYIGQYGNAIGYLNGYLDDLRITKGAARYTSNFTPPSSAHPILSIVDRSLNTLPATLTGNAQLTAAVKKYGNYSLAFDGDTDAVSFGPSQLLAFGTSDFTIECWYYHAGKSTSYPAIYANAPSWTTNTITLNACHDLASTVFSVSLYNANSSTLSLAGTTTVAVNTWYHVALVRSDVNIRLFVNGVLESTLVFSGSVDNGTSMPCYIGYDLANSTSLNGYVDDFRITQGVARYKSNFTPPTTTFLTNTDATTDPYWDKVTLLLDGESTEVDSYFGNVSLLLKCDGANGATTFTDLSNNHATVTVNGSAQVSTSTKKYGTGSLYLPSTGSNYLSLADSTAFNLAGGPYTIECWIYPTGDYSNYNTIIAKRVLGGGTTAWELYLRISTGVLSFYNGANYESTITPTANTWSHVAGVYNGTYINLFLNGVNVYSAAVSNVDQSASIYIGTFTTYSEQFKGYIDDVRVTKGVARYPVPFTLAAELPSTLNDDISYSNVSLLLLGNGTNGSTTITDSSSTPKTVSVFGNTQISTSTKKYGTGSIFFDGSGDYLTVPSSTDMILTGVDFTMECWIYPTRAAGTGSMSGSGLIQSIITQGDGWWTGGLQGNFLWHINNTGIQVSAISSGAVGLSASFTMSLNTWTHIAVTRVGTTMHGYVNGTLVGTQKGCTDFGSSTSWTNNIGLGYFGDSKVANYFQGYIDDLRITKGVVRYTANFTPPTATLPVVSINDTSTNGLMLMSSGGVGIDSNTKKVGTGSLSFNGTSSYTYYPGNTSIFNMGSLNWTVEAWVYLKAMPTSDAWPTNWSSHMVVLGVGSVNAADGFNCIIGQTKLLCHSNDVQYAGTAHGMVINTWYHLAFVRYSNTLLFFVNGVATGTVAFSGAIGVGTNTYFGTETGQGAYFNGYMDNLRVTKGVARYLTTFTPPTSAFPTKLGLTSDPYISNVSLLLTADVAAVDANWSNVTLLLSGDTLTDSSNNRATITASGNARITATVRKYGEGSIYFDGVGDYLISPSNTLFQLGTGDFTIEMWVNQRTSKDCVYFEIRDDVAGANCIVVGCGVANYVYAWSANTYIITSSTAITLNTWNHVACVRKGSTLTLYLNGAAVGTATFTTNVSVTNVTIAAPIDHRDTTGSWQFNGYLDDLRITKGVARYTSTFTPPTTALPTSSMSITGDANWSSVSLLLDGETTTLGDSSWSSVSLRLTGDDLLDKSPTPKTLTVVGSVSVSTSIKKYGTGSYYFPNNGDTNTHGSYLRGDASEAYNFGTGAFTVEGWVYITGQSTFGGDGATRIGYALAAYRVPGGDQGWIFIIGNNGSSLSMAYSPSSNIYYGTSTFTCTIPLNSWHHVAVSGSGASMTFFVDGVSIGTGAMSGTTNLACNASGNYLGIGGYYYGNNYDWPMVGYIDDVRITKGVARYTANFTPPTSALPTSGGGAILDRSPYNLTVTNTGSVSIDANTKKFGASCMAFSGSNYLTANAGSLVAMGTGDYTVEFWFYQTSVPGNSMQMFDTRNAYLNGIIVANGTNRAPYFYSGNTYVISSVITNLNQWYHIAAVRSGTTMTMYLNGVNVGSATSTYNIVGTNCYIGQSYDLYQATFGYIDDLRVTKGVARYTANFTPPTAALPLPTGSESGDALWQSVSLLINADGIPTDPYWDKVAFILSGDTASDSSTNHIAITNNNVTLSTTTKKYNSGSLAFTGTGVTKYLSPPASNLDLSTGNFTIDFWVNFNSFGTDRKYIATTISGGYWQYVHDVSFGASLRVTGYSAIVNQGSNAGWTTGVWYHVAFVRNGSTFTIFRDGVSIATGTSSAALGVSSAIYIGGYDNNTTLDAYIADFRATKGVARYTANFTPPTAALSPTLLDKSTNMLGVAPYGDVTCTSINQVKYGIGSIYFDGSGDYVSIPYTTTYFDWWTTDYTLECWVYPISLANFEYFHTTYSIHIPNMIGNMSTSTDINYWSFGPVASGAIALYYYNGSVVTPIASTLTINPNAWSHIALTKTSSGFQLWVNGVGNGYTAISGTPQSNAGYPLSMGQYLTSTAFGYIDDLRITKGAARYTSTFTPPSSALPALSISDSALVPTTVTSYGNAALNSSNKKYGTNCMYFDGSGDYITTPWAVMPTGTTDFTIEFWKYTITTRTGGILGFRASGSDNFQVYEGWPTAGEYLLLDDTTLQVGISRTVPLNTWEHLAWVRSGTKFYFFINGSLQKTSTSSASVTKSYSAWYLGDRLYSAAADFNGYIDELRITKGVARYTSDFVPQQLLTK
jgi:hypothetical protein